jgi:dihydroflavonol-4-reductase
MRYLVTGGTGLLGGNIVRELAARGHEVRVLVRRTSDARAFDDLSVERIEGDITDAESVSRAVSGMDGVFHVAAWVTMFPVPLEAMRAVNVEGTRQVCRACLEHGIRRLVHVSTVDAIGFATSDGWGTRERPSNEDVPFQNQRFGVPYQITKHEAQQVALACNEQDLETVVVNPAFMLGAYDVKPTSGRMVLEVAAGKAKLAPTGGNNLLHVRDAALGTIAAMEMGRPGELYILGNANLTYREIFTCIAAVVGVKPPFGTLPKPLALLGGYVGTAWGRLTGTTPEINHLSARLGFVDHYFDASKAVRELNLPQTPVETAIEDAWRWFRDNGYA